MLLVAVVTVVMAVSTAGCPPVVVGVSAGRPESPQDKEDQCYGYQERRPAGGPPHPGGVVASFWHRDLAVDGVTHSVPHLVQVGLFIIIFCHLLVSLYSRFSIRLLSRFDEFFAYVVKNDYL